MSKGSPKGVRVRCGVCSTVNPDGASFCMKCGSKLDLRCSNCGADLPADAAFCMTCGHAVGDPSPPAVDAPSDGVRRFIPPELLSKLESAASTGAMQGERRTVTMLFCDVQGSTSAAEQLDPEEWAEIMNGAFELLIGPVYRYEGTLARLMGDAILAFFGAPIGHEDDPERAVRAGLEILDAVEPYRQDMQRRLGIDLQVRVGINTGLVMVGAIGSDLRVEYTAMGDAVNVAARMEQTAAPGTVQIADATKRLVERLFEFDPLGPIEVKGRREPVEAHRVVAALARPDDTRGIEGLRAPMVGREAELARVRQAFEDVIGGNGRIVSVTGEAGLGKSRLVREARDAVGAEDVDIVVGRSLSYETTVPFAPVRRLLLRLLGLGDDTPAGIVWRGLEGIVADLCPGQVADLAPFLATVMGVDVPAELRARVDYLEAGHLRQRVTHAVTELLTASARRRPLIAILEDLHWADSASIDLATELLDVTQRAPLGMVFVFRPRRDEPSWAVHESAERNHPHLYVRVDLAALDAGESRTLVSSLLDVDGLPEPVRQAILDKSEGNPFFLEEVVRSLLDHGVVVQEDDRWVATADVVDVAIPDTLGAVITTRLDRLDDRTKAVAQSASVVGRDFRYDELAAVLTDLEGLDASLVELQRRDLVREVARAPRRVFRFNHALVHESVYGTVLLRRRSEMHSAVAGHLQRLQPERVEDIADHLLSAGRPDDALPFVLDAGRRALRANALPEAVARFDRALAILDSVPEPDRTLRRRALEGLGKAHEGASDFESAERAYGRLEAEGLAAGDLSMTLSGRNKRAFVTGMILEDRESALAALAATEAEAREAGDDAGLAEACMYQCYIRTARGEFDQVTFFMRELTRLGDAMDDVESTLFGMVHLANTLMLETRGAEAIEQGEAALARAEAEGHLKYQADVLAVCLSYAHVMTGDLDAALDTAARGMEIALRIGDRESEEWAAIVMGKIATARGEFEEALGFFRRADEAASATGVAGYRSVSRCALGTCYLGIGGPMVDRALQSHVEALEFIDQPSGDYFGTWVWAEVGRCAFEAGYVERAEELLRRALERRTSAMYLSRPDALEGLARVAMSEGRFDEAASLLAEMRDYVESRSMDAHFVPLRLAEARLASAMGDHEQALASLDEAADLLKGLGLVRVELDLEAARLAAWTALGDATKAAEARSALETAADAIRRKFTDDTLRSAFDVSVRQMAGTPSAST